MRSTFAGLNTMSKGIQTNRLNLETVGHNISNASTEGYSRQSVNAAASPAQSVSSIYGNAKVGSGVDMLSVTRARDTYTDRQYWRENSTQAYYDSRQVEYDKLESIFNDTTNEGIQAAMEDFYSAWSELSASASDSSTRIAIVQQGAVLADRLHTAASQLQDQIDSNYEDMRLNLTSLNEMLGQMVEYNKAIMTAEASGSNANDLRDQRDLMVDNITSLLNVNVYEDENGMYSLVSNGVTLVSGINKLTLEMSDPVVNETYGINDYTITIKESGISFTPTNGELKAQIDQIAEDKEYIDDLASMSAFLLTTFNTLHQQGVGIDEAATAGVNFFGDSNTLYSWDAENECVVYTKYSEGISASATTKEVDEIPKDEDGNNLDNYVDTDGNYVSYTTITDSDSTKHYYKTTVTVSGSGTEEASNVELKGIDIINTVSMNSLLTAPNGENLVAARAWTIDADSDGNPIAVPAGSGDGTNAVDLSALMNMNQMNTRYGYVYDEDSKTYELNDSPIGTVSFESFYNKSMTEMGAKAEAMDSKVTSQDEVMTQIVEWRSSTSGVNWDEELTNMIMFQQGYSACSRCLTTMDEMLDKLVNSTGTVGR